MKNGVAARRWSACLGLALALCMGMGVAASAEGAASALQPVENFVKKPKMARLLLSPQGDRLAMLMQMEDKRLKLAVMKLDPLGEAKIVAGFGDGDIRSVYWVNNDRLVFEAQMDALKIREGGAGTYAVNFDGSELRQLVTLSHNPNGAGSVVKSRVLPWGWELHSLLHDGSADVVMQQFIASTTGERGRSQLARLNTLTGELTTYLTNAPEAIYRWWLDAKGEPRAGEHVSDGRRRIYWRERGSDKWDLIGDFPLVAEESGFEPWLIDDEDQLLVTAYAGANTKGLYVFDRKAKKVKTEPLVVAKGFDLEGWPVRDGKNHLYGVRFDADRSTTVWLDAKSQALQKGVDATLPAGRANHIQCGKPCGEARFVVITSESDREPGQFLLLDKEKGSISVIGRSRPWVVEAEQGRRTFHRVKARDGLEIPVIVTHPVGATDKEPLPTVVVVHGGPYVRVADTSWDSSAQFLASRGYRVLEPQFRGTSGFGWKLFHGGWKTWGTAMQDDLADTVHWAAQQGLTDKNRVCIEGGSYGGYAALMSPIRYPELYKCSISGVAVTDLDLLYDIHWSDSSDQYKTFGMPTLIGDRVKDAVLLAEASPLKQVKRMKTPVLMWHGAGDVRVPIEHSKQFVSAAKDAGVPIEYVVYEGEGHGNADDQNRIDLLRRMEAFLARHLK